jgi:hypothetical protein
MKRWRVEYIRTSGEISAALVEAEDAKAAVARARSKGLQVVRVAPMKDAPAATPDALPEALSPETRGVLDPDDVDRGVGDTPAEHHDEAPPGWTAAAAQAEKRAHRSARSERLGGTLLMLGIVGLVSALLAAGVGAAVTVDAGRGSGTGWFWFAILLGSVSTFLLILGAIYHAAGRLGVDLAEMHEQRARAGEAEER